MPKRLTTEDYINRCKKQGLDLPIEDYVNNSTKIKHKCKYGHIYEQRPDSHLHGFGCNICSRKKHKTPEEYYQECKDKGLDLPIEDYVNNSTKIKHKCIKCGNIYYQRPHAHLNGNGCPFCKGIKKKTSEEYYQECKSKGLDLPIEDYVNSRTKSNHKCNKCGNIYEQTPKSHLKGSGCPLCGTNVSATKRRKSPENYYNECKSKGYDLPSEHYVNTDTKIKHRCIKGHVYEQTPHDHLRGKGCPNCNGTKKKTPKG